jgi:hypothetical protein
LPVEWRIVNVGRADMLGGQHWAGNMFDGQSSTAVGGVGRQNRRLECEMGL